MDTWVIVTDCKKSTAKVFADRTSLYELVALKKAVLFDGWLSLQKLSPSGVKILHGVEKPVYISFCCFHGLHQSCPGLLE